MKRIFILGAVLLQCMASYVAGAQSAGKLDSTFGVNGTVSTRIGGTLDRANDVVIQQDSCIILGGGYVNDTTGGYDLAIVRYLPNGRIDSSYGRNGIVRRALSPVGNDGAARLLLQPDGKLVFFGTVSNAAETYSRWCVGRYTTKGQPDSTFGVNGFQILDPGITAGAGPIISLPGGGFFIAGSVGEMSPGRADVALGRLKANGTFDSTFGTNGYLIDPVGIGNDWITSLLLQRDGRILAGGSSAYPPLFSGQFTIIRYLPNGVRDSSYGTNGLMLKAMAPYGDGIADMAFQSDGKVIAVGPAYVNSTDWGIARIDTAGLPDPGFRGGGGFLIGNSGAEDNPTRVIVLTDDKILVGGNIQLGQRTPWLFTVRRFLPGGAADPAFGNAGETSVLVLQTCTPAGMALQPGGKIIMSGFAADPSTLHQDDFAMVRFYGTPPPPVPSGIVAAGVKPVWEIFPNPAGDFVTLRGTPVAGSYQMCSTDGRMVQRGVLSPNGDTPVSLQAYPPGLYLLQIFTAGGTAQARFVKH